MSVGIGNALLAKYGFMTQERKAPLVGRWLLDHREPDGGAVYLPFESFTERLSRAPRPGIEFFGDGTFSWLAGGTSDGYVHSGEGRWEHVGPLAAELHPESAPRLTVVIVEGTPTSLKVSR